MANEVLKAATEVLAAVDWTLEAEAVVVLAAANVAPKVVVEAEAAVVAADVEAETLAPKVVVVTARELDAPSRVVDAAETLVLKVEPEAETVVDAADVEAEAVAPTVVVETARELNTLAKLVDVAEAATSKVEAKAACEASRVAAVVDAPAVTVPRLVDAASKVELKIVVSSLGSAKQEGVASGKRTALMPRAKTEEALALHREGVWQSTKPSPTAKHAALQGPRPASPNTTEPPMILFPSAGGDQSTDRRYS